MGRPKKQQKIQYKQTPICYRVIGEQIRAFNHCQSAYGQFSVHDRISWQVFKDIAKQHDIECIKLDHQQDYDFELDKKIDINW